MLYAVPPEKERFHPIDGARRDDDQKAADGVPGKNVVSIVGFVPERLSTSERSSSIVGKRHPAAVERQARAVGRGCRLGLGVRREAPLPLEAAPVVVAHGAVAEVGEAYETARRAASRTKEGA